MSSNHRARYRGYVTFRLDLVSTLARMEADKIYERECGLGIRHLRVLRRVAERPGASVSEIVESTMFERTLVSRLISDLVGKALLERRISPVDARQFNIDITPEGLAKAEFADELGDELNEDLLSSLDANERIVFDRCLEKLVRWQPKGAEDAGTLVSAPVVDEDFTPPDGVTRAAGNRRKSRK